MTKYGITTMMSKYDVIDGNGRISDEELEYLIKRHNTLSEVESILASCSNSLYCLKQAMYDVDTLVMAEDDKHNTITLFILMNVMNELIYFQTTCEQQSENIDDVLDVDEEEENNEK